MSEIRDALGPPGVIDARRLAWMTSSAIAKITAALESCARGASRFVGGCVRDSLLGVEPKDIDIATALTPGEVVIALHAANLKAAPTGVEHGTVTGIADHVGVEITTLRADVSTDGRRAAVAFTKDWRIDAARRDFRLNAIYLTFDGRLFDPVGGVADARSGRVRFIDTPADRIREDYLRILRFFRFSARFARGFDAEGLAACAALRGGVGRLSAERVGDEFRRILALSNAGLAIDAMAATGVLEKVWPAPPARAVLRRLKDLDPAAPAPVGLAALWSGAADGLDRALRLSNADAGRRKSALAAADSLHLALTERAARALLYRFGSAAWRDGALLAQARAGEGDWSSLRALPDRRPPPRLSVSGKNIVAAGVAPGPNVSEILKAVEARWIEEDFPDETRLAVILAEEVARAGEGPSGAT